MRLSARPLALPVLVALVVGGAPLLHAADSEPAPPPARKAGQAEPLASAREHIAAKRWTAAVDELQRVNLPGNADWNNLMGFALRKQPAPDLAAAERFYDEALRLDPRHRGALEYSGELYLMKGELPRAEQRLAALGRVCLLGCEEYADLKQAIERYKASGNRYLPE
jgi:tetratricopeptide (TPR) repeat protein